MCWIYNVRRVKNAGAVGVVFFFLGGKLGIKI